MLDMHKTILPHSTKLYQSFNFFISNDIFSLSLRLEESWKIYVPLVVTLRYGIHTKYYDTNADLKFLIKVCFYFLTWQPNRFISMQLPT